MNLECYEYLRDKFLRENPDASLDRYETVMAAIEAVATAIGADRIDRPKTGNPGLPPLPNLTGSEGESP